MRIVTWAKEEYLHSKVVIRHRHTGVAVPAHMNCGVGTMVCLLIQRCTGGVYVILRLLLHRNLIR